MISSKTKDLPDLLLTLKRKEISIEAEEEYILHGGLVYVGDHMTSRKAFITIKDVLNGNTRVPFKNIHRVWYHRRVLWNNQTKKVVKKSFVQI